jgi:hypothetical protein
MENVQKTVFEMFVHYVSHFHFTVQIHFLFWEAKEVREKLEYMGILIFQGNKGKMKIFYLRNVYLRCFEITAGYLQQKQQEISSIKLNLKN